MRPSVLAQLRALAPYPTHAVVRPVAGDTALVKPYLDIGAQTLLVCGARELLGAFKAAESPAPDSSGPY